MLAMTLAAVNEDELLTPEARDLLNRAREARLSYAVRLLEYPGDKPGILVLLGEAHLKLAKASALGRAIVGQFELRGVETFQVRKVAGGRVLAKLIHLPRVLLRMISLGYIRDSTITDAKSLPGTTIELESGQRIPLGLHVGSIYLTAFFGVAFSYWALTLVELLHLVPPELLDPLMGLHVFAMSIMQAHLPALVPAWFFRRESWSWLIHPLIAILTTRDVLMAEGTARMLRAHPEHRTALVIMGRAHLSGYERELVEKHGFRRVRP